MSNTPEKIKSAIESTIKNEIHNKIVEAFEIAKYACKINIFDNVDELVDEVYSEMRGNPNVMSGCEEEDDFDEFIDDLTRNKQKQINLVTRKPLSKSLKSKAQTRTPGVKRSSRPVRSQYKGVSWNKRSNKWRARLHYNGASYELGKFETEIEAAKRYDKEKFKVTGGDLSLLNFPGDFQ